MCSSDSQNFCTGGCCHKWPLYFTRTESDCTQVNSHLSNNSKYKLEQKQYIKPKLKSTELVFSYTQPHPDTLHPPPPIKVKKKAFQFYNQNCFRKAGGISKVPYLQTRRVTWHKQLQTLTHSSRKCLFTENKSLLFCFLSLSFSTAVSNSKLPLGVSENNCLICPYVPLCWPWNLSSMYLASNTVTTAHRDHLHPWPCMKKRV